jgi:phosphatidylserine decarboxylase
VKYLSGDTWNVNPIALKRIEKLFCKNERAVVRTRLAATGHVVTMVPVAAILVASIRLHCLEGDTELRARASTPIGKASFQKGEEMGWFQHGSTIIVFAPDGFALCGEVREGTNIRMGEPLMRLP